MSEPRLISPMLDNFAMGDPISEHHGVRCCPAMENDSDNKYIVKIISIPASRVQLDALLLAGAYPNSAAALDYFKELSDGVVKEAEILKDLSDMEGFLPFKSWQVVPMNNEIGYDVYLLSDYRKSLERFFRKQNMTHLNAVNLGLDLCASMAICRHKGYLFVNIKPDNIFLSGDNEYRIGDIGFIPLSSLKYESLPERYHSSYTAPEIKDSMSPLNSTLDIYAIGLVLYQCFNGGILPFEGNAPDEPLPPPEYADYEISEIIMKACSPNPEDRYQDPMEMGQELIRYMQRNRVNDTPIVPSISPITPAEEQPETPEESPAEEAASDTEGTAQQTEEAPPEEISDAETSGEKAESAREQPDTAETVPDTEAVPDSAEGPAAEEDIDAIIAQISDAANEDPAPESASEEGSSDEGDDLTDLSFLDELENDETRPDEAEGEKVEYTEISDDTTHILLQADDLIAHEAPAPVVPPEPIEVPIPEPLPVEKPAETAEPKEAPEQTESVAPAVPDIPKAASEEEDDDIFTTEPEPEKEEKRHFPFKGILITLLVLVLLAGLTYGAYFYYTEFYLIPVEDMSLSGAEKHLTDQIADDLSKYQITVN